MPVSVNAVGATAAGAGNITVNYPTRSNNDILILFVETAAAQPVVTVTAGTGGGTWTKITDSQGTDTTMNIWWSRWTTGQASSLTVTDTGDHQIGGIISFSGCVTTGNPFESVSNDAAIGSNTSGSFGPVTTTYYNTEIVGAIASGRDANFTAEFSGYTNSNLTNITERFDAGTNSGNGGGFGVFTADFTNVGPIGISTVTIANATAWASVIFALIATDSYLPHTGWGVPID